MATYQQRKTGVDPTTDTVDPAASNVNITQRSTSPETGTTGIIIAVVVVLIGAILAFNYGWFDGSNAPSVTQNNNTTTETVPQATAPETSSSTVAEPDSTTSTTTTTTEPSTTTTTEPSASGSSTTTTTTDP